MKIVYILILIVVFISCNNNLINSIKELQSASVQLPKFSNVLVQGKDIIIPDFMDSKLKLIVFSDSVVCSSCSISNMLAWTKLLRYSKEYNGSLKFYFIFSPNKVNMPKVRLALMNSPFDYPVLLDTLGEFEKLNPHLPKNNLLHTFLLDENNQVILVGDPLHNKKIEEMFYKIVEEKLGKPQ